jgi:hypothetical protein
MASNKQELSPQDQAKIEMRELQKKVLMGSLSSVIGMNGMYGMGDSGRNIADSESLSNKFQEQRGQLWDYLKQGNKSNLPVEMPTNQATVNYGLKAAEEAKQMLTIGDLYEVVQGIRKTKDLEDNPVPEKFKDKGLVEIVKAENEAKAKFSKLSKEQQAQIRDYRLLMSEEGQEMSAAYASLSSLYDAKTTERTFSHHNGRKEIETLKEVFGKYIPKKDSEKTK